MDLIYWSAGISTRRGEDGVKMVGLSLYKNLVQHPSNSVLILMCFVKVLNLMLCLTKIHTRQNILNTCREPQLQLSLPFLNRYIESYVAAKF